MEAASSSSQREEEMHENHSTSVVPPLPQRIAHLEGYVYDLLTKRYYKKARLPNDIRHGLSAPRHEAEGVATREGGGRSPVRRRLRDGKRGALAHLRDVECGIVEPSRAAAMTLAFRSSRPRAVQEAGREHLGGVQTDEDVEGRERGFARVVGDEWGDESFVKVQWLPYGYISGLYSRVDCGRFIVAADDGERMFLASVKSRYVTGKTLTWTLLQVVHMKSMRVLQSQCVPRKIDVVAFCGEVFAAGFGDEVWASKEKGVRVVRLRGFKGSGVILCLSVAEGRERGEGSEKAGGRGGGDVIVAGCRSGGVYVWRRDALGIWVKMGSWKVGRVVGDVCVRKETIGEGVVIVAALGNKRRNLTAWDYHGRLLAVFDGFQRGWKGGGITMENDVVAAGCDDGIIRLWDMQGGAPKGCLHLGAVPDRLVLVGWGKQHVNSSAGMWVVAQGVSHFWYT